MAFFTSWLRTRKYSLCTDAEKAYIHNQIEGIVSAAEQNRLHMKIPTKMLVSLKLADETPVTVSVEEFVTICVDTGFITRPFIVSYEPSAIVFSFVQGLQVGHVKKEEIEGELMEVECDIL